MFAPPLFSRDGWSYAAQGELTRIGLSPYVWGPGILDGQIIEAVDPRWMLTPAPYGPLPLLGGGFAAELFDDPWLMVIAHRVLAVLGLLALAWAVPRLASWAGYDGAVASAMVLASPLMLAHGIGGVHNDRGDHQRLMPQPQQLTGDVPHRVAHAVYLRQERLADDGQAHAPKVTQASERTVTRRLVSRDTAASVAGYWNVDHD